MKFLTTTPREITMKTVLIAIALAFACVAGWAQTTSNRIGSTTYFNNNATGLSGTVNRIGDTSYMRRSDGLSSTTNRIGDTAYTRDGEFQLNASGQLVTKQGYPVLSEGGPIVVELDRKEPLSISASGEISQGTEVKGKLKLTAFSDEHLLKHAGGGLFLADDPALQPIGAAGSTVRQGWLEGSNASVVGEMANLLIAMRTYEANQRVIQMHDERMGKAITELAGS